MQAPAQQHENAEAYRERTAECGKILEKLHGPWVGPIRHKDCAANNRVAIMKFRARTGV